MTLLVVWIYVLASLIAALGVFIVVGPDRARLLLARRDSQQRRLRRIFPTNVSLRIYGAFCIAFAAGVTIWNISGGLLR